MLDLPFTLQVWPDESYLETFDNQIMRQLSDLEGQFLDEPAYENELRKNDTIVYEVFEKKRPELAGELLHGISIIHPGKIGDEYYMTKGHFHDELATAEIYYCLQGEGMMVMETLEGDWSVEAFSAGDLVYVCPSWAHRSVNVSLEDDLVMLFVYPGNSGHDYGSIEHQGFRKVVVARDGQPAIIDNPRWVPPEER